MRSAPDLLRATVLAVALALPHSGIAAESSLSPSAATTVLARTGSIEITVADYQAELTRLPEDSRAGFGNDPVRVEGLLNNMLLNRILAAQARERGIDKDDVMRRRVQSEIDKIYGAEIIARLDAAAGAQFDALADTEQVAKEQYLVQRDSLRTPEQIGVTHILFGTSNRSKDEALRLARDVRARIVAGESMTLLARQLSDDPSAKRNGGRLDAITRDKMDPAFTAAAFALPAVGDISDPVPSQFGIHLIRLESRRAASTPSFEQARARIVADLRKKYVERRRGEELAKLRDIPDLYVNRDAVDALITLPDKDLLKQAPAK
jgi:hypothetical protein